MKWSGKYKIDSHDIDFNGIARPSSIIKCMQQAANGQLREYGPSHEELRERGLAFLISRLSVAFYAPVYPYDVLNTQTWGADTHGFSFGRCYQVFRRHEIIAEATSVWALVRIDTRRPVRVDEFKPNFSYEEMLSLDLPPRIVFPHGETPRLIGEHTVCYGESDQNKHMNNTRYADMFCDFLPMGSKRPHHMSINFINEAPLHETLQIYNVMRGDDHYFRTIRSDGKIGTEAQIVLGDI